MVQNENEFIRLLVSQKTTDNDVDLVSARSASGLSSIDFMDYLKSASNNGYILQTDLNTAHIYPKAINLVSSKRFSDNTPKLAIKSIVKIVVEILVGLVVTYLAFRFGFQ